MYPNPEKRMFVMGKLHGTGEPAHVIRTIKLLNITEVHARIALIDQNAGNVGTLVVRSEDLCDLVHLLAPKFIEAPEGLMLPLEWVNPPDCQWRTL